MNRTSRALSTLGLLGTLVLAGQTPALAAVERLDHASSPHAAAKLEPYGLTLVDHTKQTDQVNYGDKIGQAQAGSAGVTVSITKTSASTRTIDYGFGVSRDFVAAQLNISSASSVGTNVSCSKAIAKKGRWLVAYSVGSIHRYRIKSVHKVVNPGPPHQETTYSDWMYTYNPYVAGISCRVQDNP